MGRGKKKKGEQSTETSGPSEQHESQQPARSSTQQERPPGPQGQQQQRPPGPQGQQKQRPPGPQGQQQQRPPGPQGQQQQRPPGPQGQQQQRPPGPQGQQQQRPPGPQGQQQQRPPGPQGQQQWRPQGPQGQQQQLPPGPQGQQQWRPQGPQGQQQQRPPGPQGQQQQRPPGPQGQQQQRPPGPQGQQQWRPQGPQGQQQQRPPGPQGQQQQRPPGPQGQQQQRPPGPQGQQQQRPPGPQGQQQQRPPGPQGQQQWRPQGQQQQRPPGPQGQQQQRPPGPQGQQQQRPPGPQGQQQWRPQGPQGQQQQRPPGPQGQQQQRPPTPQEQQQKQPSELQGQQQQLPSRPESSQSTERTHTPSHSSDKPWTAEGAGDGLRKRTLAQPIKGSIAPSLALQHMEQIPLRRNPTKGGTKGTAIRVETNMFQVKFGSNFETNATHYDVDINPDKPKFLMRPVFEEFRKANFPTRYPAFDGKKNAYSAQDLPFGDYIQREVKIYDNERQLDKTFTVTMQKVATLDLSWLTTVKPGMDIVTKNQAGVQALDIILRHGPSNQHVTVGKSFFPIQKGVVSLSNGMDLWVGVFSATTIGWKTLVNIDVAHKAFPMPQNVIDLMKELCGNERNRVTTLNAELVERNKTRINSFLKGLKVQYEIPGNTQSRRTLRVNGLVASPRKDMVPEKSFTVEEYFAREKGYRIKYPDIPCVWIGSRTRTIHVPPELCTIVADQDVRKQLDENQTRNMIKYTATDTQRRKQKIMDAFETMKVNNYPTMAQEFKLSVQGKFETVPARVLNPPMLLYDKQIRVSKGQWRLSKFKNPKHLEEGSWTILNLDVRYTRDADLYFLTERLQQDGVGLGMTIGKPCTPFAIANNPREMMQCFEKWKAAGLKLVIVILPAHQDVMYSKVKQMTEVQIGVLTQCLKAATLRKIERGATIQNILLKINSKLNGVNHSFVDNDRPRCLLEPCIIFGADVTHPSPGSENSPSIAAVVASHCPKAFQYNIELRLQDPKVEIIQEMEEIVIAQLKFFYRKTGYKPLRIIFYRDGVSEGHLAQVMQHELLAIRRACTKLSEAYKPQITFLVVQKRHHVRLFPTDSRFSDDKNFNVQAGTIVDTEITHPTQIDFYLVSHASIQGTARPTKYRCLCNESDYSEDEIEQLTYYLCHMFARCPRSVSYPAPTYYAHLAAFRARALIQGLPLNMDRLDDEQRSKLKLKVDKDTPMFFV